MYKNLICAWIIGSFAVGILFPVAMASAQESKSASVQSEDLVPKKLILSSENQLERKKPRALRPGDCIGIVSPATGGTDFNLAIDFLHKLGYTTKLAPSAAVNDGFFAGSDEMRAADLNAFFKDSSVQAILCLRGGYGSVRILSKLDYAEIAKHPKLLIGYSDITALHTAIGQKSGLVTIHGPMLVSFKPQKYSQYTAKQFAKGLQATSLPRKFPMPNRMKMESVIPGRAEGKLVGGNLAVLASMVGTPYELDGSGCILLLEDIGEKSYRIDRLMQQLSQNGLLGRVKGIALGEFLDCDGDDGDPTAAEVLLNYAKMLKIPVIKGVPAGHGKYNAFLPMGVNVVLDARADGKASLIFDENYAE